MGKTDTIGEVVAGNLGRQLAGQALDRQPFEVRITLDHMRSEIARHFAGHTADLEQRLAAAVDAAIAAFDWRREVEALACDALQEATREALRHYFGFGEGRAFVQNLIVEHFQRDKKTRRTKT